MWVQHGGPPGYHPWWGVFGGLLFLLLMAALIGLVVWAVVRLTRDGAARSIASGAGPVPSRGPDLALEHARYRYARGEIDRDEFVRISQDLGAPISAMPPPPASAAPEEPGT